MVNPGGTVFPCDPTAAGEVSVGVLVVVGNTWAFIPGWILTYPITPPSTSPTATIAAVARLFTVHPPLCASVVTSAVDFEPSGNAIHANWWSCVAERVTEPIWL